MKCEHFVLIKFNIQWGRRPLYTPQEIEDRIELFKKTAGASLKAQTEKNFKTILFLGDYTPHYLTIKINELCKEYNMIPYYVRNNTLTREMRGLAILSHLGSEDHPTRIIITRLDSDNAFAKNYIESIQKKIIEETHYIEYLLKTSDSVFLSFTFGYGKILNDPFVYEYNYTGNAFFSMIVPLSKVLRNNGCRHKLLESRFYHRTISIKDTLPMWTFFIHENNAVMEPNELQKNKRAIANSHYTQCFEVLEEPLKK